MTDDEKAKTREAFEAVLSQFHSVFILVGKHPALVVPAGLSPENGRLVLEYGLDMPRPIPDLEATDDGIKATLSFACEPVATFVPWESVQAMKGRGERPKQRAKLRAV